MFRGLRDTTSSAAKAETQEDVINVESIIESDDDDDNDEHNINSGSDDHSSSDRSGTGSGSGSSTSQSGSSKSIGDSSHSSGFWGLWGLTSSSRNDYNVGQKESLYVSFLKLVVIGTIVVSGVFVARATYDFMVDEQVADFEDEVCTKLEKQADAVALFMRNLGEIRKFCR